MNYKILILIKLNLHFKNLLKIFLNKKILFNF